jgi:N-acetylneuraminic acid mutarotase
MVMKRRILPLLSTLLALSVWLPAQNIWQQKANFSAGQREGAISFAIGDKGYVGTGSDGNQVIRSDFWEYDPATDTWTQKADYGGGIRYLATAFTVGSKAYAGTGITASYSWREDMWEYDPATNVWTQKNNFPGGARYTAAAFSIGSKGYMGTGNYRVGPADNAYYFNDFYEYDPATDTWTRKADVPEVGRTNAIGMSIGSKGYIGMGFYYYDTRRNDLWEYDPALDTWTRKADMPASPRFSPTAFSIGARGYICGGWYFQPLNDLWQFDPVKNSWTQKELFPGANRYNASGFAINGKAYFGLGGNSAGSLGDFWEYSPDLPLHAPHVQFDPAQVSTAAGNGQQGFSNGAIANASFNNPFDMVIDAAGNMYVADNGNHAVRKITPQGLVTTLAGNGTPGFANGSGTNAQFNDIAGLAIDLSGNIIVADRGNHRIRSITPAGVVSTVAGTGVEGFADGDASTAQFAFPSGVAVDANNNIYVADRGNNRVRKILMFGYVSTFAGNGTAGDDDGIGTAASFNGPIHVAVDRWNNVYVSCFFGRLRKISPQANVTSIVVENMFGFFGDLAVDSVGNLYVSVMVNGDINYVNKVTAGATFTRAAGSSLGYVDGYGEEAKFYYVSGLTLDKNGNLYVPIHSITGYAKFQFLPIGLPPCPASLPKHNRCALVGAW